MKRRILSMLLVVILLGSVAGCGRSTVVPEDTANVQDTGTTQEKEPEQKETETVEETAAEPAEGAKADGEESSEKVTTGGSPWIDSSMKENLSADMEVSPRDDFHLYANKQWLLESEIPAGYEAWSHYSERALEVKQQCMELLKDESIEGHDAELIRTYNKLVLDWDKRNELGVSVAQDLYDIILGIDSIDDLIEVYTAEDTIEQYFTFIDYGTTIGLNDPDTYICGVSPSGLLLQDSAEYSERSEYGDMYYGYWKELFTFVAGKFGMAKEDAESCYENAIRMETTLAKKIYTTKEKRSDDYYDKINNEMSFEEVVSLCKVFPVERLLTASGYKYDGIYLVTSPDYLKYLDEVYTQENLEDIKSLMMVRFVLGCADVIDRETYDKTNEIANNYFGTDGTVPDEQMAYESVVSVLPASMQKVYIAKYGSEEDKKKMEGLCQEVIDTYRELLSENTWASDEVKNYALEKLDKIVIHAAYPDKFRDTSGINIDGCNLFEAVGVISDEELKYSKSLLGKKKDDEMWAESFNILSCNAFYSFADNTINMIIGMMGEPFYSSDMSIEELYASIGAFWVGHEISHAFDNNGAQFDAEGAYRDWWTAEDKEEFNKRVQKMDDYLDKIVAFGDYHFIGTNIDTEMVADMTGLQCALRMASKVDGFDYDKFFTKYARMNGILALYSYELEQVLQNEHPLDYSRTNVPVQQFEEFYETYDVKEGDGMYLAPEDRLVIW